jgi:hypothetical protein
MWPAWPLMALAALVPAAPPYDVVDHFPLAIGNSWTWIDAGSGAVSSVGTIGGKKTVSGAEVFVRRHTNKIVDYLRPTATGIEWYGGVVTSKVGELPWTLEQPIRLPNGMKVGDGRAQSLPGTVGPRRPLMPLALPATLRFRLKFEAVEDVDCPAGRFRDCLRFAMTFDSGRIVGLETRTLRTVWYARGIGDVKSTVKEPGGPAKTYELRSATIGGRKIP